MMSPIGTFQTCRPALTMSVSRGKLEVVANDQNDANDPGCVKTCTRGDCAELFSLFSPSTVPARAVLFLFNVTFYVKVRRRSFHTAWTQSGHQPQRQHRALVSRPPIQFPRQNRWSLQQLDSPRDRNVVSNVAKEEMRYRQNRAAFPLEAHSAPPALRAGRMDRSGRPEVDNDIVEQYNNPKELALPRAP
jgi:hypothetical protein